MPAKKKKAGKSTASSHIHHKYHHHIHFTTLIAGIVIFLVLIFMLTKLLAMKQEVGQVGTNPTCLTLDTAVMNKDNVNYLTFDSEISVPFPKDAKIECRLRYSYKDDESQFGTITYSHPADIESQACIGQFPLAKPPTNITAVEVELVPVNITNQVEGNICVTSVNLPK